MLIDIVSRRKMIKILCQFCSCLVDIWEVCERNSELNAQVLEHFLKPPQQLLFLSCGQYGVGKC